MQFRVTEAFVESFDGLDDEDAFVDEVIARILDEHDQAWAPEPSRRRTGTLRSS